MGSVKERFGQAIRKRRNELDITQEQLAESSGLHRTYLADVERGKRNISLENIVKLIDALNLSLAEFFKKYFRG